MRLSDKRSIVGVAGSSRTLSYVLFEDGRLLDWRTLGCSGPSEAAARVNRIMEDMRAEVLVFEDPSDAASRKRLATRTLLENLAAGLPRPRMVARPVRAGEVRRAWRARGARNKQAVAAAIAASFPELAHIVPPPRKNYMNEDERVHVFEALALVLHAAGQVVP
jgi:hypothetical protein